MRARSGRQEPAGARLHAEHVARGYVGLEAHPPAVASLLSSRRARLHAREVLLEAPAQRRLHRRDVEPRVAGLVAELHDLGRRALRRATGATASDEQRHRRRRRGRGGRDHRRHVGPVVSRAHHSANGHATPPCRARTISRTRPAAANSSPARPAITATTRARGRHGRYLLSCGTVRMRGRTTRRAGAAPTTCASRSRTAGSTSAARSARRRPAAVRRRRTVPSTAPLADAQHRFGAHDLGVAARGLPRRGARGRRPAPGRRRPSPGSQSVSSPCRSTSQTSTASTTTTAASSQAREVVVGRDAEMRGTARTSEPSAAAVSRTANSSATMPAGEQQDERRRPV